MTDPMDERLLALLENRLPDEERLSLLDQLADDPELLAGLADAAEGIVRIERLAAAVGPTEQARPPKSGVPSWWLAAAAAITLLISVPTTLRLAPGGAPSPGEAAGTAVNASFAAMPTLPAPSYMLVLSGVWPDRADLEQAEISRRADEYWDYVIDLTEEGVLVAAGDVRFDGGSRLDSSNDDVRLISSEEIGSPDHLVGILTLRVDTYEEAVAVAARSPHLRYGGNISVREVGLGFVAVPGMDDWSFSGGDQ